MKCIFRPEEKATSTSTMEQEGKSETKTTRTVTYPDCYQHTCMAYTKKKNKCKRLELLKKGAI